VNPSDETAGTGRRRRAAAMPPDERRAAIVTATLPLLLEHGLAVTTRHIAEAAGIAEGTIFRVFPDKETLVQATVDAAIDPSASERALDAIDRTLPFEEQLVAAATILQHRVAVIWRLFSVVGSRPKPPPRPPESPALTALFAAHDHRIRVHPGAAARRLRALTLAASHPALAAEPSMSAPEIVSFFLDGVRSRPAEPATDTAAADAVGAENAATVSR
jgi:AcrR family transcriptional regulator